MIFFIIKITVIFFMLTLLLIILFPLLFFKSPITKSNEKNFDAIVVLGFPAGKDGKPSPIMRERVLRAVELYNKGWAESIICSGAGVYNKYVESDVMINFAKSLGVSDKSLIKEDKARNTYENIQNILKIMKDNNWCSVIVVTSPWHIKRTNYYLSKSNITYVLRKSNYPKELPIYYIIAIFIWESYLMTKTKFKGW